MTTTAFYAMLVDLDRCVGCWACEVACQQENAAAPNTPWILIKTIGPELVEGKLRMEYVPISSSRCNFCRNRGWPACVDNCPTKALEMHSQPSLLSALSSTKRYQICKFGRIDTAKSNGFKNP